MLLYYSIPLYPVCTWGVGVPGVAALLPSSSGELHQSKAGTLWTSRRSSGFSIQQETPAGWKGCSFLMGPDFSLTARAGGKGLPESAAQKPGVKPSHSSQKSPPVQS